MTRIFLASVALLFVTSCGDTSTEPGAPNGYWTANSTWAGQIVIAENTGAPRWPSDPVTIVAAAVEADSLVMTVSYGGGCREHSFILLSDAAWMESYPVQVGVRLSHDGKDDMCDALVTRVLKFDLSPLKVAYKASYRTTTGIIRMNIRGFSSVEYSW